MQHYWQFGSAAMPYVIRTMVGLLSDSYASCPSGSTLVSKEITVYFWSTDDLEIDAGAYFTGRMPPTNGVANCKNRLKYLHQCNFR